MVFLVCYFAQQCYFYYLDHLEEQKTSLKNKIGELQKEIKDIQLERDALRQLLEQQVVELQSYKQELEKKDQIISNLQQKVEELINLNTSKIAKKSLIQIQKGLKNLGNTCYINSALQVLRHMQIIEPQFLNQRNSKFSNQLKEFFEALEDEQDCCSQLSQIVSISKTIQEQEAGGGDSYVTLFNFLNMIIKEQPQLNTNENLSGLSDFQKYFTLIFQDGLQCCQCYTFYKEDHQEFCLFEEMDSSLDIQSYEQIASFTSVYGENNLSEYCSSCKKNCLFITKRRIKYFPQFMVVKLPKDQSKRGKVLGINKIIEFDQKQEEKKYYEIIGFCTYTGCHYTYTGKFYENWYTFNDSLVSQQPNPSLQQAIYLLLKKQISS